MRCEPLKSIEIATLSRKKALEFVYCFTGVTGFAGECRSPFDASAPPTAIAAAGVVHPGIWADIYISVPVIDGGTIRRQAHQLLSKLIPQHLAWWK